MPLAAASDIKGSLPTAGMAERLAKAIGIATEGLPYSVGTALVAVILLGLGLAWAGVFVLIMAIAIGIGLRHASRQLAERP